MDFDFSSMSDEELTKDESKKLFQPLPKGTYLCTIDSLEVKEPKRKGNPYINAAFTVVRGEYANRKLFFNIRFQDEDDNRRAKGERHIAQIFVAALGRKKGTLAECVNKPVVISTYVFTPTEPNQNGEIKPMNLLSKVESLKSYMDATTTKPVQAPQVQAPQVQAPQAPATNAAGIGGDLAGMNLSGIPF